MNVKKSNRWTIVALVVLFVAPVAGSYILHYAGWQPEKTKNRGDLLASPVPMAEQTFSLVDGSSLSLNDMKHSWGLLYIGGSSCDKLCEQRMNDLRRVHLALGKNQKRVHRLYLDDSGKDNIAAELKSRYPKVKVLAKPAMSVSAWKAQLDGVSAGKARPGMVFIIDPLGNAIMSYQPDADATGIRKDMGRLLHVSQVG